MTIDATTSATSPSQSTTAADNTTATSATVQSSSNTPISAAAAVAQSQQQLNIEIVQASMTVSISSKNDQMTLLFKSVITNMNEAVDAATGKTKSTDSTNSTDGTSSTTSAQDAATIQAATSQDNSPAGTAGRIVSASTALFNVYKQSFPGEDESTVLDRFMKVIQGGIDTGFKEARGVLNGMGALNGSISDNIDKTYSLVTQGLADFAASTKAAIAAASGVTDSSGASTSTDTDTDTTPKAAS